MAIIDDPEGAARLARAIAADLWLYGAEKLQSGKDVSSEITEGRALYEARVSPEHFPLFDEAMRALTASRGAPPIAALSGGASPSAPARAAPRSPEPAPSAWGAGTIQPTDLLPPSLAKGIGGGFVGALLGALAWAGAAAASSTRYGFLSVLVGALAGVGVSYAGNPTRETEWGFRVSGGVIALLGVLLGETMSIAQEISAGHLGPESLGVAIELYPQFVTPMTLVLYGIAVFAGFKLAGPRAIS